MKQIFTTILVLVALLFGQETKASCWEFFTIDSLPQLKEYDFIAHVKILDIQDYKNPSKNYDYEMTVLYTIKIIELFKGDSIRSSYCTHFQLLRWSLSMVEVLFCSEIR